MTSEQTPATRRAPVQARSRKRVGEILDAAERLVVDRGVDALTTREIAQGAGVPVASLYQYFADKEAVLLALAERDMAEMDLQLADDVAAITVLSVRSLVETSMRAFVKVYLRRPAFVEIYLRGRSNPAVHAFGRVHNHRVATALRQVAIDAGLVRPDLSIGAAVLAVEVGDRVFQLAFEHDATGEPDTIEQGIIMVTAYFERHAA